MNRSHLFLVLGVLLVVAGVAGWVVWRWPGESPTPVQPRPVETFEECEAAGYPIMDSYPQQCQTPDGRTFTRVTPEVTAAPVTLTGVYTCLSEKDTGGPTTLDCAFGLQTETGDYALDLSAIPSEQYPSFQTGDTIRVVGTLIPPEAVSQDRWTTFDVAGVVAVQSISL